MNILETPVSESGRAVMFVGHNRIPLLLTHIQRAPDGTVATALVENGCWYYERRGDLIFAVDDFGRDILSFPAEPHLIIYVPSDMGGNYNTIIARVERWIKDEHPNSEKDN